MGEPSSDATKLQVGELIGVVRGLEARLNSIIEQVEKVRVEGQQREERINEKFDQRRVPWTAIVTVVIASVGLVGMILGAFVIYHVSPIKKDLDELGRKLDRDMVSIERRLATDIEASRREIAAFKEEMKRDATWNYAYNNLRHDHNARLIEKIWPRVFTSEPPAFQQPSRPAN